LIILIIFGEEVMKRLITQFCPIFRQFISLSSKYSQHPLSTFLL
jgi:hypothetical protein